MHHLFRIGIILKKIDHFILIPTLLSLTLFVLVTYPLMLATLPPLPKAGHRIVLPTLYGSSDAYVLCEIAKKLLPLKQLLVIFVAEVSDAQRLKLEMNWLGAECGLCCSILPDWETLPYDTFSPHQDLVSEKLATLYAIQHHTTHVLIVPITTALLYMAPPAFLAAHTFFFKKNTSINEAQLKSQLTLAGYHHVNQVVLPGEYAVRGGLIDLFPMGSDLPYRLDLFDHTIETIRTFDVDTQRTLSSVDSVRILPGHEFPTDEAARTLFRTRWRETFEGDPSKIAIYKDMSQGITAGGIEYYLPLFFTETATLFDYLPATSCLCLMGDINHTIEAFWEETTSRYHFLKSHKERPILPPEALFLKKEAFFNLTQSYSQYIVKSAAALTIEKNSDKKNELSYKAPHVAVNRRLSDPLTLLRGFLSQTKERVLICADSNGRQETLKQYMHDYDLSPTPTVVASLAEFIHHDAKLMLTVSPLYQGFSLSNGLCFITETELYETIVKNRFRENKESSAAQNTAVIRDLSELKIGDPIVHVNHGVGRYQGLIALDLGEGETEFLHLQYAKETSLYVPVSQLHMIARYSGTSLEQAPLHALGSQTWDKAKQKAAQQCRDTAAELLSLYASRAAKKGHAFTYNQHDYLAFAEGFGFEETPDQQAAIDAVIKDMTDFKPMDRLICGDVGFGKTEVALRAAFVAVMGGHQVALLCPTTLLAEQHTQTFIDRFANWPIKIAEFSRFKSKREINAAIEQLKQGTIDIAIGTHKLLSSDIHFNRLGLVIIDEEHRFGVRQKEMFKSIRKEVDVLTLTATPIPRTLGMALEGLRDFSIIATAPQKRLAIKTFVRTEDHSIIREACLRELKRGGQVYFLHNEVDTIDNRRAMLEKLLPEARIVVGHGQMHERDLERVMRDFVAQRYNILLCTTIIETGIDVPSANTIIMHRADKFGLAQLHQLRGRVGRSHHQAYAYLLVHDMKSLTTQAQRRLEAIVQMEELGSGFYLAMHDLEIRGAGEILGEDQSGEMLEIGFQLYSEMLNEAVRALKSGKEWDTTLSLTHATDINLHAPALLPQTFCGDVHQRLSLYKRFSDADTLEKVLTLHEELIDRFGQLPEAAKTLVETHKIRVLAKPLGIIKIDANIEHMIIQFVDTPPIEVSRILELVQKNKAIQLEGQNKLRIRATMPQLSDRITQIKSIIHTLQS